jgi:pimeloyl-[acyl-carrier protein] synthase
MSDLWRPFDPGFIKDPYPVYQQIREQFPYFQSQHNEWVFMRYADVKEIIKDPRFRVGNRVEWLRQISTQQNPPLFGNLLEAIGSFLLFKNELDHTQLRRFITHAWRDKEVKELIRSNIAFLAAQIDWDNFDFAKAIGEPLPALTMAGILGVPPEEYPFLIRHSRIMIRSLDTYLTLRDLRAMEECTKGLAAFYKSVLEVKKRKPDNSLMSKMLEANQRYSLEEISYSCIFLFISGEETTAALLSLGLFHLIKHNKWNDLTPGEITENMVDEMIRFDPPTQIIARYNPESVSLPGLDLESNSRITLCLASANRDPDFFERPDELLFDREAKHLSFGYGFHHCLGDWLAKAEALELWSYLRAHFREINLAGDVHLRQNLTIRSVESMYISCRS